MIELNPEVEKVLALGERAVELRNLHLEIRRKRLEFERREAEAREASREADAVFYNVAKSVTIDVEVERDRLNDEQRKRLEAAKEGERELERAQAEKLAADVRLRELAVVVEDAHADVLQLDRRLLILNDVEVARDD